ncbi:hypothetical protein COCON_G00149060 [Conger conger]|uniref:Uncharacterized protein n=1 Tax=Conger conger TaxID=82655 RepID=A0A9Q1DC70_CONCO|nr:hypothetical protein COCON_G00149060 [Conger conger]
MRLAEAGSPEGQEHTAGMGTSRLGTNQGQQIPMASYAGHPVYDAHGKPIGQPEYQYPAYAATPAPPGQLAYQPGIPQPYPAMVPGPYPPYPPVNPEYGPSPPPPYSPPQYPGN